MIRGVVRVVLTNVVNVVATSLMVPTLCVFLAWKFFVLVVARLLWKDRVTLMRGQDAVFTLRPNGVVRNSTVVAWVLLDGVVTKSEVAKKLERVMFGNPRKGEQMIYRYIDQSCC